MASNPSDRSWNDPPVVQFEVASSTKKPSLLKKRVVDTEAKALTDDSKESSTDQIKHFSSSAPPTDLVSSCEITSSTKQSETNIALPDEEILPFVLRILQSILHESTDEKAVKEINRRIDIMKDSWNSKLSKEVKDKMLQLVQELEKGNIDEAFKVHWSLMIQNVREVKNWMVGIKHILEMKREKSHSSDDVQNKSS